MIGSWGARANEAFRGNSIETVHLNGNSPDTTQSRSRFRCQKIVGFHMTSLKFKLKNLSILPRFYLHDALEQLKANFHTNFRFKRVLGFVIEDA